MERKLETNLFRVLLTVNLRYAFLSFVSRATSTIRIHGK